MRVSCLTALGVVSVALLAGCEAQTTVVTTMELPPTIPPSARSGEHLHVVLRRAPSFSQKLDVPDGRCPPFDVAAPSFDGSINPSPQGFEFSQSSIPSVPEFCAAAWFDTNHNGKVDSGDAVGQFAAPYPCQPSKLIGSNRYKSPPLVLELVR